MAIITDVSGGGGWDFCRGVAIQSDGKIVAVGDDNENSLFAVVRYTTAGALDASFGVGGIVLTSEFSETNVARAVAIQSDGKIVVAGDGWDGTRNVWAVVRYNTDGTIDTGFGVSGIRTIAFIGSGSTKNAYCYAVKIQSDGKIVLAGSSVVGTTTDFTFARLTTSGALDAGFATSGKGTLSTYSGNDYATSIAIQPDGKIILTGPSNTDWAAVRLTTAGAADTSFGVAGIAALDVGTGNNAGNGVFCALQSDGSIVLAGYFSASAALGVARISSTGALDAGFGTAGFTAVGLADGSARATAVVVLGDDKIIAAGYALTEFSDRMMRVVKLTAAGAMDSAFGTSGVLDFNAGPNLQGIDDPRPIYLSQANSVAIQSDGKILLTGYADSGNAAGSYNFAIARINADGTEDTLFGSALTISAGAAALGPLVAAGELATAVVLDAGSATLGPLVAAGELYLSLLLGPGAAAIGLTAAGQITLTNAPLQAGFASIGPLTAVGALAISRPIPPHVLATRYSLTLTGAADGLPDAALPLANWQAVARLVGSTYLTCTVPLSSAVEAAILARPHGTLIVRQHLIYASETITAEIVAAPWDAAPRIDEGGRSASITLAGLAPQPARAPKSVALRGVSYRRLDGGATVRSAIDLYAAPGDTLDYGDGDLVADQIAYICTPGAEWMEARSDG